MKLTASEENLVHCSAWSEVRSVKRSTGHYETLKEVAYCVKHSAAVAYAVAV